MKLWLLRAAANISKAVDNDMKDVAFWSKCVNHALERGVKDALEDILKYEEDLLDARSPSRMQLKNALNRVYRFATRLHRSATDSEQFKKL